MPRIRYRIENPEAFEAMLALENFVNQRGIESRLLKLIKIRASQINGCAWCLDMHTREALDIGEDPRRLFVLSAWRETIAFTDKERAALALTEAVTMIAEHGVPDDIYMEASRFFSARELVDLIMAINTINGWNRLAITCRMEPAVRQPG